MSSTTEQIFNKKYDSYSALLFDVLKEFDKSQTWLVANLLKPGQKFESLQQTVSRWVNGSEPGSRYKVDINQVLQEELLVQIQHGVIIYKYYNLLVKITC